MDQAGPSGKGQLTRLAELRARSFYTTLCDDARALNAIESTSRLIKKTPLHNATGKNDILIASMDIYKAHFALTNLILNQDEVCYYSVDSYL